MTRHDYEEPGRTEVESARLLENEARDELHEAGLTDEQIRKLADTYVAETDGDPDRFRTWALERADAGDLPSGGDIPES